MKAVRMLLLCGAVALPQLALAGLADTSPQGLGIVHAYLDFCTKVDPRDAASFKQEWNSIVGSATAKQFDALEDSNAYAQASASTTVLLENLPKSGAAANCAVGAAQWRGSGKLGPTPIYVCPSAADGRAFTTWLEPCVGGHLALPVETDVVASQIAAKGYTNWWALASKLKPGDHVWTGTVWVAVSTVTIAPAPTPGKR